MAHSGAGAGSPPVTSPKPSPVSKSRAARAKGLTSDEIAELREIFNLVDKDHGGTISKTELAELLMTLGIKATNEVRLLVIHLSMSYSCIFNPSLIHVLLTHSHTPMHVILMNECLCLQELDIIMREVDRDGSNDIDFGEFLQVMQRRVDVPYTAAQVKAAFKVFEDDCPPGYIKIPTLIRALQLYGGLGPAGEKISDVKIAELVSQLEPDSTGMVNYDDFISMMLDV